MRSRQQLVAPLAALSVREAILQLEQAGLDRLALIKGFRAALSELERETLTATRKTAK